MSQGSFRLFRFAGVDVFLHWSWFLVAVFEIQSRAGRYSSPLWNVLEYSSLFGIVLLHEFGHALACKSVGGQANRIILWPLGGIAFVQPPPRPGPTLWSIAAGPLVNVALAPVLTVLLLAGAGSAWLDSMPNAYGFVRTVWYINLLLLIFNLLPIYPLDGGQILRSLLWFLFGRARSLMIATTIGFVGVGGLIICAVLARDVFFGILCAFILLNCWGGLMHARLLAKVARLPRRQGFACPACHEPPVLGPFWRCGGCMKTFDSFETQAICPHCGTPLAQTGCLDCGTANPLSQWAVWPTGTPPAT